MNKGIYLKEVGQRIKTIRMGKKISLLKLSAMCGTCACNLSHIENARKNPRLLTLKGIADSLGVDVKEFL
jgi:transcriptional regulator with XRE-family HTH domain